MKAPKIGELRHVAVFKRPVVTTHATGQGKETSVTTLGTMRAKFSQLNWIKGAEVVHADQVTGKTAAKLTTRYLAGVVSSDRVTVDDVDYEITWVENVGNLDRWMVCAIIAMDKAA